MEKGIDLSLTKSLADFDALLDRAVEAATEKLSLADELNEDEKCRFQVGKYFKIDSDNEDEETPVFWIGYDWERGCKNKPLLWLEFDARTCPKKYWQKIYFEALCKTSGNYFSEIDLEFSQEYMNAWVHFYLKEEYLKQFYDENADINAQKEILTCFVNEALSITAADTERQKDNSSIIS